MVITFHSPDPMKLLLSEQPHQQVQEDRQMVITFRSPDPMRLLLLEQPHQQVQEDRLMGLHCHQSKNPRNSIQFFILIYILVFIKKLYKPVSPLSSFCAFFYYFFISQLKNLVEQGGSAETLLGYWARLLRKLLFYKLWFVLLIFCRYKWFYFIWKQCRTLITQNNWVLKGL